MARSIVSKKEVAFLKHELIKKYCLSIQTDNDSFEKKLTGTLSHYEKIADHVIDEIVKSNLIKEYAKTFEESPTKYLLRQWTNNEKRDANSRSNGIPSFVTANVLRKLLFFSKDSQELSFNENFILACYIYLSIDRNKILNELNTNSKHSKTTQMPLYSGEKNVKNNRTIHPDDLKETKFRLIPLKTNNDQVDNSVTEMEFIGDDVILNRDNLDPENNTITSKVQAIVKFVDGQWLLENQSKLNTTYIQVLRPTKINRGDIIVFGNKRFLFEE